MAEEISGRREFALMAPKDIEEFLSKLGTHRTDIMSRRRQLEEILPADSLEFRLNAITAQNLDLTLTQLNKIIDTPFVDAEGRQRSFTTHGNIREAASFVEETLDDYLNLPFNVEKAEKDNEMMERARYAVPSPDGSITRGPYLYDRFRALQTDTDRIYSDETGRKLPEADIITFMDPPGGGPGAVLRETRNIFPPSRGGSPFDPLSFEQQYKDFPYPEDDPTREYELNRALLEKAHREPVSDWTKPGSLGGGRLYEPQSNLVFEQMRRWDPYADVSEEMRKRSVANQIQFQYGLDSGPPSSAPTPLNAIRRPKRPSSQRLNRPDNFADGGPVLADRNPILPGDPLFIQDDLGYSPEVLSDMQAADVTFDPSLYPPLPPEEPDMIDFAKDRLIDVGQGFADIPGFVANYFVQPDEQGQPSFISPQEFGQDVKNVGMAMGQAIAEDPVGFALDITPGISNVRAGMEANRLYEQANVQEAQGDEVGAAKTRSMASLTTTDMLNPVPTAFAYKAIFAGPMAQKAPQKLSDKRLDQLEEVSDDTLAQEVFEDTNAFIGLNGKRQFEIDTSNANVDMSWFHHMYQHYSPNQLPRVLPEILNFPELYENYPQLKDVKVELDLSMDSQGIYYPRTKTMKFNLNRLDPDNQTMTSTVLHETQHAVQDIEGDLLQGSYPSDKLSFSQYERLPIEVDARNVQKRFEFPQKKDELPKFTQGVNVDELTDVPALRRIGFDIANPGHIDQIDMNLLFKEIEIVEKKLATLEAAEQAGTITPSQAAFYKADLNAEIDRLYADFGNPSPKSKRPPIQYDLPFDAQNRPQTTRPVPRNPLDQSRSDPYESPADTRDRQRRRKKRGYAEGGIVSLANGGAVEHGIVTL